MGNKAGKKQNMDDTHALGQGIDFMGKSKIFAVGSVVAIIIAAFYLVANGVNYGIDFAGGTEVQTKFSKEVNSTEVRNFLKNIGYASASVQAFGDGHEYLMRFESLVGKDDKETNVMLNALIAKVTAGLKETFPDRAPEIRRVDSVGPQIGSELKRNGILAAFYSLLLILIYVGLRFDYKYAPSAVICLLHDSFLTLVIFISLGKEVNVQTMAAILTIIGYSLNDTIINFDRIRENTELFRGKDLALVTNRSINDVLSRTILTSLTTLLAVGSLYVFAGGVIEDFALTLGIGVVIGTYSSIYVAAPLVLLLDKLKGNPA